MQEHHWVKSLFKFSGYGKKEVNNIIGNDSIEAQDQVEHCGNAAATACQCPMGADIVYLVAGFIFGSVFYLCFLWWYPWKKLSLDINTEIIIQEDFQSFVDEINKGDLGKPRNIVYPIWVLAWDIYLQVMENSEDQSLFLSSKMNRSVFSVLHIDKQLKIAIENINVDILETTCLKNHIFDSLSSKTLRKFFNFVSETKYLYITKRRKKDHKPNMQSVKRKNNHSKE